MTFVNLVISLSIATKFCNPVLANAARGKLRLISKLLPTNWASLPILVSFREILLISEPIALRRIPLNVLENALNSLVV